LENHEGLVVSDQKKLFPYSKLMVESRFWSAIFQKNLKIDEIAGTMRVRPSRSGSNGRGGYQPDPEQLGRRQNRTHHLSKNKQPPKNRFFADEDTAFPRFYQVAVKIVTIDAT
jgi:hypothetical protein